MSILNFIKMHNDLKTPGHVAVISDAASFNNFWDRMRRVSEGGVNVTQTDIQRLKEAHADLTINVIHESDDPALQLAIMMDTGQAVRWFATSDDQKCWQIFSRAGADFLKRRKGAAGAVTISALNLRKIHEAFAEVESRIEAETLFVLPGRIAMRAAS